MALGRPKRWEDKINMNLKETDSESGRLMRTLLSGSCPVVGFGVSGAE
jgi:hypothetical protein